jgi:hypothetical protein
MKTSLTLSTVLFALTLTPAAFANGAQEQTQAVASAVATATPTTSVTVFTVQQMPQAASVTRTVLEQLDVDVRANLLSSLRASSAVVVEALQIAAPALVEVASKPLELSSR